MQPGMVLGGRFEILDRIGQGGHGAVFRALQRPLGREVAVKMLLAEAAMDPSATERFAREATLVKRLEHPNTVRLYDFGTTDGGMPFMVFELLRGESLADVVQRGPLDVGRVAHVTRQVLKSLMEAHGLGIVHRDVKPSNILLVDYAGERDFVKVLDFGVARSTTEGGRPITQSHQVIGTPAYMAPEQITGAPISPATDLYALGLVMAEAIAGGPILTGAPLVMWLRQSNSESIPIPPAVASSVLGSVVRRATNKDPAQRYASAEEMLADIEAALAMPTAATDPLAKPFDPQRTAPLKHETGPPTAPLHPSTHVMPPLTPLAMSPSTFRPSSTARLNDATRGLSRSDSWPGVAGDSARHRAITTPPPTPLPRYSAAGTAPPPSGNGRALVFVGIALFVLAAVLLAGIGAAWTMLRAPAPAPAPKTAHPGGDEFARGPLAGLSVTRAADRLRADGWSVNYENQTKSAVSMGVTSGFKDMGRTVTTVAIYDVEGEQTFDMMRAQFEGLHDGKALVTDHRRILTVSVMRNGVEDRVENARIAKMLER